jgi:hypothetical protein
VTAVPVVAGKGVRLTADTENNRWVVEADETVLWEGACLTQGGSAATLSEAASNFEKIAVYAIPNPSGSFDYPQIFTYDGSCTMGAYMCPFMTTSLKGKFAYGRWEITNGTSFNLTDAAQSDSYPTLNFDASYGGVVKVVGINRIASN